MSGLDGHYRLSASKRKASLCQAIDALGEIQREHKSIDYRCQTTRIDASLLKAELLAGEYGAFFAT
jgi:hypothetical protein